MISDPETQVSDSIRSYRTILMYPILLRFVYLASNQTLLKKISQSEQARFRTVLLFGLMNQNLEISKFSIGFCLRKFSLKQG